MDSDSISISTPTSLTPYLIDIPGSQNDSGSVHFWENFKLFPSGVQRCFWISGVKEGETRGNHAHWKEAQVLVAMAGKLMVEVEGLDAVKHTFELNSPGKGVYIPALNWVQVSFSPEGVLLGLADRAFEEEDYIRDKNQFGNLQKGSR